MKIKAFKEAMIKNTHLYKQTKIIKYRALFRLIQTIN
jgi:hypothetical protein